MAALTVVVTWLALYIFNSISGGYSLKPVTTRNPNNNAGIGYDIHIVWRPLLGRFEDGHTDLAGCVFSPLIVADRAFVHRSIDLIDPQGYANAQKLKPSQLHPEERPDHLSLERQP